MKLLIVLGLAALPLAGCCPPPESQSQVAWQSRGDRVLGVTLVLYGVYTVYLLVRRPEDLATTENHPSWTHMYRMMMLAQVGFALAYLF